MKATLSAVMLLAVPALAASWDIVTPQTAVTFSVKHMMVSNVHGSLGPVTGKVDSDDKDATKTKVDVTIDVKGINTGEPSRDGHLKTADFFDVEKFPTATFKSKKVEKGSGDNNFKVTGDLTIHGVTKEVVLDTTLSPEMKGLMGGTIRGFSATTKINRTDFGLKWNKPLEAGAGMLVGDDVTINIDGELMNKGAPAAKKM